MELWASCWALACWFWVCVFAAAGASFEVLDLGRMLNLFFRFAGWSTSWLVGAVVMIVGAKSCQ